VSKEVASQAIKGTEIKSIGEELISYEEKVVPPERKKDTNSRMVTSSHRECRTNSNKFVMCYCMVREVLIIWKKPQKPH
jgi:hypothetical protein